MQPLIIVAAVNGGNHQSHGVTRVPITPQEIAEETARCREAGAAVVHFHARDEEGLTTGDVDVFRETMRLIREKSDILIQPTNGIGQIRNKVTGEWGRPSDEVRLGLLNMEPRPDLYGAATGTTDYHHPYGGHPAERPYINNRDWLIKYIRHAHGVGSAIEFEVVHMQALYRLRRMADEGVFDSAADYLWLLHAGGIAYSPGTPRYLLQSIEEGKLLFPNAKIGVMGAGPHQFQLAAVGFAAGCDSVRVGLEDNLFRASGEPAESNRQLVAETVELARFFQRRPATPDEARHILGLNRAPTQSRT